jgi:hypothetical protein
MLRTFALVAALSAALHAGGSAGAEPPQWDSLKSGTLR